MPVLLFVVGAIAAVVGVGMVGYGVPVREFSFGNTLIIAGTTATVGGLIVIAIGAAVAQLHRIAETLATRPGRPLDIAQPQPVSRTTSSRIPFPPRPRSETSVGGLPPMDAPVTAEMPADERADAHTAPMLQNPDSAAVAAEDYDIKEYEEVSLSPQQPLVVPASSEPAPPPVSVNALQTAERRPENPAFDVPWRSSPPPSRPPQPSYFDAMWPAEPRPPRRPAMEEAKPESKPDFSSVPKPEEQKSEPQVAILKSGVVDGMGYTLYVDGSIEAELSTGTLRFASINELRSHLARNN